MSESRPEWILSDLAVLAGGGVTVPIYPTLSSAQARYILQDCGARLAIVSGAPLLEKIQEIRHLLPALQAVVIVDAAPRTLPCCRSPTSKRAGHARLMAEWGAAKAFRESAREIRPGDLATIIYTSGTTGEPKGVMLTHANLVSNLRAAARALDVGSTDVALSFLPLSHAFERMVGFVYLLTGVRMIFAESFDTVGRDVAMVRPTVADWRAARLREDAGAHHRDWAGPGRRRWAAIFQWAMRVGGRARPRDADRKARRPAARRAGCGGGSARLRENPGRRRRAPAVRRVRQRAAPPAIAQFFQGLGVPVIEGYGLTESAPILTVNPPHAPRVGTVGKPLPGIELRIAEDGEILARGPNVMSGYYNQAGRHRGRVARRLASHRRHRHD